MMMQSERHGPAHDIGALAMFRLALGGALIGLSVAALASLATGLDRTMLDWIGGVAGFGLSLSVLVALQRRG